MLSFVHPMFLLALAGLAVPVALHLMERERPDERPFPSIRFIRPAHLPQQGGRRRLRDLFLLLLRLLFMAALILVFARPVWRPRRTGQAPGGGPAGGPAVFLVDLSASMNANGAMAAVRRTVDAWLRKNPGRPVGLVGSAAGVVQALPISDNRQRLKAAVAKMKPTLLRGQHAAALDRATALLRGVTRGQLVVLSDFQETDWRDAALRRPAPGIGLELVNVNPGFTDNVGVLDAAARPLGRQKVRVTVSLRNYGFDVARRTVEVRIGSARQTVRAEIPAGEVVRKTLVLPKTDGMVGRVVLDPDAYRPDDEFMFWAGAPPAMPVLAAGPFEAEPAKRVELFFLRKALEAVPEDGVRQFKVDVVDVSQFFALNLQAVDAIFLLGALERFQEGDLRQVRAFVEKGGTVFCTPGKGVALEFKVLQTSGLASLEFRGIAGQHRQPGALPFSLGWVTPEGRVGRLFKGERKTDLFLFAIRKYARFKASVKAHVLLKMEQGDPALVETSVGRGRLYVSAFGFEPSWSDFPLASSFLPFLRELLADAGGGRKRIHRFDCGAVASLPPTLLGGRPKRKNGGKTGIDTSRPAAFSVGGVPVEVNVSRQESVVRRASLDILRARWSAGRARIGESHGAPDRPGPTTGPGRELWRGLVWAAALFFLLELLVASLPERGSR